MILQHHRRIPAVGACSGFQPQFVVYRLPNVFPDGIKEPFVPLLPGMFLRIDTITKRDHPQ